jgi:hypothetical protein
MDQPIANRELFEAFTLMHSDRTKPSTYLMNTWINAYDRSGKYEDVKFNYETIGKWCIFSNKERVDADWKIINDAVESSQLWVTAKVATKMGADHHDGNHVICVYTPNWEDKESVFEIRETLRRLGFVEQLKYKRDADTRNPSKYGSTDEFYYTD